MDRVHSVACHSLEITHVISALTPEKQIMRSRTSNMPSKITAARVESDLERIGSPMAWFVRDKALTYSPRAAIIRDGAVLTFPSVANPRAVTADDTAEDGSAE